MATPLSNPKVFNRGLSMSGKGKLHANYGTATDSSQAATINFPMGKVTSSTTNLGADTAETLTITNNLVTADSVILCMTGLGGSGSPVALDVVPSAGSFTVNVRNVDASNACTAAYELFFVVFEPNNV